MAGGADSDFLGTGCGATGPDRLAGTQLRLTGEIGGQIAHVLLRQARGLGLHRPVGAHLALVTLQGDDQVVLVLPAEFRHAEGGVGVAVARNAMATHAGLGQYLTVLDITRRWQRPWQNRQQQQGGRQDSCHSVHREIAPTLRAGGRAAMLVAAKAIF